MLRYLKGQIGFTLVEVLVGLLVTGIVMVGIVQLFHGTLLTKDQTERKTQVQLSTRRAMDEVSTSVKYSKKAVADGSTLTLTSDDGSQIVYQKKGDKLEKTTNNAKGETLSTDSVLTSSVKVTKFVPTAQGSMVTISLAVNTPAVSGKALEETLETSVSALPTK